MMKVSELRAKLYRLKKDRDEVSFFAGLARKDLNDLNGKLEKIDNRIIHWNKRYNAARRADVKGE